ncbi:DUF6037 family protein [Lysinibacillus sp. CNPSo 3705]|uniref:DUF6037 family protein n=1 Tax=Lysinibacillus sp. CNPSo 3705 TaxID=3028148 RepID=UPI00236447CB|nr:DUF6037 family protein [Lysinibacillus sp. CNPSo 3705]MDD1503497.1 DUF6037 family protein [Lysinibacillus sp. CNPSo 3705]
MALIKLDNLSELHLSMIQNNLDYQVFGFKYNKIEFSALLIYEVKDFNNLNSIKSYTLTIFKKETAENMRFDLVKQKNALFINSYFPNYREITNFLEHKNINYDPNNPFKPKDFFTYVDKNSPINANNNYLDRKICAKYYPTIKDNEQDKVYFYSFRDNRKHGQNRSPENYWKTEMLIPEANKVIGNRNISVRFTADEKYKYNESKNIREKKLNNFIKGKKPRLTKLIEYLGLSVIYVKQN